MRSEPKRMLPHLSSLICWLNRLTVSNCLKVPPVALVCQRLHSHKEIYWPILYPMVYGACHIWGDLSPRSRIFAFQMNAWISFIRFLSFWAGPKRRLCMSTFKQLVLFYWSSLKESKCKHIGISVVLWFISRIDIRNGKWNSSHR